MRARCELARRACSLHLMAPPPILGQHTEDRFVSGSTARPAPHRAQTSPYSTPMPPLRHTPTFLPAGGRRACALAATAAGLVSELEQHQPPPSCALHRRQGVRARQHLTCPMLSSRRDSHTHTHTQCGTWLALRATAASARGANSFILLTGVGRGRRFVENHVAACRFRFLVGAGGGGAQRHHHSGKDHRTVVCFAALESHGCGGCPPV